MVHVQMVHVLRTLHVSVTAHLILGGVGPSVTFPSPTHDTLLGRLRSMPFVICREVHPDSKGCPQKQKTTIAKKRTTKERIHFSLSKVRKQTKKKHPCM